VTETNPAPAPHGDYLDRLMRRESFSALWPLFAQATKPAKELTESFSALHHLRPWLTAWKNCRVIHIGDGAHARTAALFALKSMSDNISIDPLINEALVGAWRDKYHIDRFAYQKVRARDARASLNALPRMPVLVTFVHAHVDVDEELAGLHWDAAYTLACCTPGHQLTREHIPHSDGHDWAVLSPDRHYQVLLNPRSNLAQETASAMVPAES
jgi:hypothetical protein